jgi:gamma-F420-2:alpha-L-glutamate ligase
MDTIKIKNKTMLNGWIISDKKAGEGFFSSDVIGELKKLQFKMEYVYMMEIDLEVASDKKDQIRISGEYRTLPDFAICLFQTKVEYFHFALLRQLEMLGVFSLHKSENIAQSLDKMYSYQKLHEAGIPVPKTILMTYQTKIDWVIERIGLPMVIKIPDGSKGDGVCLVHSKSELKNIHELYCKNCGHELLSQEFIATSKGRDARITMCDGNVVLGIIRNNTNADDFRSNVAVGGIDTYWEPDEEAIKLAKEVVRVMNMKLCGIDLLFGENGYIVGEINSMPGFGSIVHDGKSNLHRMLEAFYRAVEKHVGNGN